MTGRRRPRASAPWRPCLVRARRSRASPSSVRGPVLRPPCMRQRNRPRIAGARHGQPARVRAPHRGARPRLGLPRRVFAPTGRATASPARFGATLGTEVASGAGEDGIATGSVSMGKPMFPVCSNIAPAATARPPRPRPGGPGYAQSSRLFPPRFTPHPHPPPETRARRNAVPLPRSPAISGGPLPGSTPAAQHRIRATPH